ncbi:hypothetical protein pipiens_016679 [Culex pipiens pipiens]|uniref:Uncharacterized protein n=1 Tax=Culex pipiens pipiens TaxID=38569 RepID=A0ABD1CK77_CULPP
MKLWKVPLNSCRPEWPPRTSLQICHFNRITCYHPRKDLRNNNSITAVIPITVNTNSDQSTETINVNQQNMVNSNNITSSLQPQSTTNNGSAPVSTVRTRLHTEPTPDQQHSMESSDNSFASFQNTSMPPKSPCTPIITRGMGHMIQHRFTKKFKDCKSNVPPSCGLPPEFVEEFKKTLRSDTLMPNVSPNLPRGVYARDRNRVPMHGIHGGPDSSSAGSSFRRFFDDEPYDLVIDDDDGGVERTGSRCRCTPWLRVVGQSLDSVVLLVEHGRP